MSNGTAFAGLLALYLTAATPLHALAQSSTDDIEAEARASERLRRMRDAEAFGEKQKIEVIITSADEADQLLARLQEKVSKLQPRLDELLTNDEGRVVAHDNIATRYFIRIQEDEPLVTTEQIAAKRKAVQQTRKMLEGELKRPSVGYSLPPTLRRDTEDVYYWAKDQLARANKHENWLEATLTNAPKGIDLKSAITLGAMIRNLQAQEIKRMVEAREQGEQSAKEESRQMVIDAARFSELEKGRQEADRVQQEALAAIERMRIEHEMELKKMRAEHEARLAEVEIRYGKLLAEVERDRKIAEAEQHAVKVDGAIRAESVYSEAEKKQLVQRCKDPEVQRLLAPFLAHGYSQPGSKEGSFDKGPVSLSALRAFGALEPTTRGLEKLLFVGTDKRDKERPRWGYHPYLKRLDGTQRDELRDAQKLLVELGDVMVEVGMLQP